MSWYKITLNMAKVLIIDDDLVVSHLISRLLTSKGHQVLTTVDGDEGIRVAAKERPDVAIVDLMMPGKHGFAVMEALRKMPSLSGLHMIACSLKTYPSDVRAAKSAGANVFLPKPIEASELYRMVDELLTRQPVRVRFWGTRGSVPTPGAQTVRYGGNTPCTAIRVGEHILVLDAGTGLRALGVALMQEFGTRPITAHIFVGHTHWDHIQGFPFFTPAYVAGNEFWLYSVRGAGKPLEGVFRGQMADDYFPVLLTDMRAQLNFVELSEPFTIGPMKISYQYLNHPGVAAGCRIEVEGRSIVYIADHEPFWRIHGEEAGKAEDQRILDFARHADLLIREAQYTEEEYPLKKGWGHSTFDDAVNDAAAAEVRQLAIFHHDPMHDDDFLDAEIQRCQEKVAAGSHQFTCFAAREGQTVEI